MILRFFIFFLLLVFTNACSSKSSSVTLDDPLTSGREFIESSLQGNYANARKHLLPDSVNLDYFNGLQNFNEKQSPADISGYKNANIIIDSIKQVTDSVTIIHYSNTYKNKPDKIKMLKVDNNWLVDFKYTFQ